MSFCPKCGALNDDGAMFCVRCGAAIETDAVARGYETARQAANPYQVGADTQTVGYDVSGDAPEIPSNAFRAFIICMKKYANAKGRASRSEIWGFWLVQYVAGILTTGWTLYSIRTNGPSMISALRTTSWIGLALSFILFLPNVCVFIRRLHDVGMSGWCALIRFAPQVFVGAYNMFFFTGNVGSSRRTVLLGISLVGGLFWLVISLIPSSKQPNEYGLPPQRRRR